MRIISNLAARYHMRNVRLLQDKHREIKPGEVERDYFSGLGDIYNILLRNRDGVINSHYAADVICAVEETPSRRFQRGLLALTDLVLR